MLAGKQPIWEMDQDCSCAASSLINQLNVSGFSVVKSFDLLSAIAKSSTCISQMIILLVYRKEGPPATVILDGNNCHTLVFLENDSDQFYQSKIIELLSKLPAFDQSTEDQFDEPVEY